MNQKLKISTWSILLTLIFTLSNHSPIQAEATNTVRSGCSWLSKRYVSKAKIKKRRAWSSLCKERDSDCYYSAAYCNENCDGNNVIAYAITGTNITSRVVSGASSKCNAGIGYSDLGQQIWDEKLSGKFHESEGAISSSLEYEQEIDENNRKVLLRNGKGQLFILKNYPGFAEIQFTIWKARDDIENGIVDDEITEEKTVRQEYIRIKNNSIEISDFLKSRCKLEIKENDNSISVKILSLNFDMDVDDSIDLEKEFAFSISSFSDPDFDRIVNTALEDKAKNFRFFPNPSSSISDLRLSNSLPDQRQIRINLFNTSGQLIDSRVIDSAREAIPVPFVSKQINNGTYFISISGEGIFEVHKVIIQRE